MAIGAHGCHREPAFHQSLAVYALCIPLDDFVLASGIPCGSFLTLSMATAAQIGDSCRERRGAGISLPRNTVRSVTFFAGRRIRIVLRNQLAMQALRILLSDFGVAGSAVNIPCDGFTWPHPRSVHSGMALAARGFCVTGLQEIA
jgi:hypothetical protein